MYRTYIRILQIYIILNIKLRYLIKIIFRIKPYFQVFCLFKIILKNLLKNCNLKKKNWKTNLN